MRREATSCCAYCDLPLPRTWWHPAHSGPRYCCFGCRFAAEVTRARGEEGAANWTLTRLGLAIFLTLNVLVFTMALWTSDFYGADEAVAWAESLRGLFRYTSLVFALPVLLLLGGPLLESAWQTLREGRLATDLLLLVGVAASYLYSVVSVVRGQGPVYFEVGCAVLVLVTLGRWLEATGKLRTTTALEALHRLLPDTARLATADGECSVPLAEVRSGDLLRVLPGERIPCDGHVRRNSAAVDEQVLTGESQPVLREVGDPVLAGSLNLDGDLHIEATAGCEANALTRMIELVRQARQAKGRHERLADSIAAWFLPAVSLLAVAAFAWHGWRDGLDHGVLVGLAVLLIACPCALGLATPLAVWAALGRAAKEQVLFRNGEALERLAKVRAVRLDKTGTLTTGAPVVVGFAAATGEERGMVLALASALAAGSTHAHCQAIRDYQDVPALADRASVPEITDARTMPGRGVSARRVDDGEILYLGSPRWLREVHLVCPAELAPILMDTHHEQETLTCLGWQGSIRAVFVLHEELRPEAAQTVARLCGQGLDVAVLTGDQAARAQGLTKELGVAFEAELLPEDKVTAVIRARHEFATVAMVGDGINDAPALAVSDVGVAMGCGADVARDSASVCLLGNDLSRLPWAIDLARQTVRTIRGNLFWAFAYNVVGVGFACTGRLNPVLASLAMVLSSLFVLSNSLRLAGPEPSSWGRTQESQPAATPDVDPLQRGIAL
jgi:heavy metal translocating P-type ATPase